MKILYLTFLIYLILGCGNISAETQPVVAVIQHIDITPFQEALAGFTSDFSCIVKHVQISNMGAEDILEHIHALQPDIVLAIGTDALKTVQSIQDIPIIYMLVLNPNTLLTKGNKNITGVSLNIPQKKQLSLFLQAMPRLKNIGLIYDPNRMGEFACNAQKAAETLGVNIITNETESSKNVPSLLLKMKGRIDALWILPDLSVITPKTVDFILHFSFSNHIPLFAFSEKYVKMGALISINMDPFDIGVQAGEIAKEIESKTPIEQIKQREARKAVIAVNLKIAQKFKITLQEDFVNNARRID